MPKEVAYMVARAGIRSDSKKIRSTMNRKL